MSEEVKEVKKEEEVQEEVVRSYSELAVLIDVNTELIQKKIDEFQETRLLNEKNIEVLKREISDIIRDTVIVNFSKRPEPKKEEVTETEGE